MIVGVPKEIKAEENRVAITPSGVAALVSHGHRVLIERGAGRGSGISDRDYRGRGRATDDGARGVATRRHGAEGEGAAARGARLPAPRARCSSPTSISPATARLTRELLKRKVTAIAYETLQLDDGSLPLLAPMSEVAGRLAVQVGAWCLEAQNGGGGVLLSGASGVRPGKVVMLGGGIGGRQRLPDRRRHGRPRQRHRAQPDAGCATCTTSSAAT